MGGHIVLAPDKFKGSLTAQQAAGAMKQGVCQADPSATVIACPVADGGEGTLEAVVAAGFERIPALVTGPTGEAVQSSYARMGSRAVVEMADVCGLQRLRAGQFAPMTATSYGLGTVIAQALDDGCRDIVITIGGSASTDGGAGMLSALGAKVLDRHGRPVAPGGGGLADATRLDLSGLHRGVAESAFTLAADVDSPLCGPHGAAIVYGPQKSADDSQVAALEEALSRWADLVEQAISVDFRTAPGAGVWASVMRV